MSPAVQCRRQERQAWGTTLLNDMALPAGSPEDVAARLDRLPVGRWHVRARVLLGASLFFDAVDLLAISFALPAFVEAWQMSPQQVGFVLSAAYAGQILGAIGAGALSDRFGRLTVANVTIGIFSVMSLACAFATGPLMLMLFRFVQGIGLGGEIPVATTYVVEIAPREGRGRFFLVYQVVFIFGQVGAGVLGRLLVPSLGWRSMFVIGALPALLTLVLRRTLPESPRWLAGRGRHAEADAVMRRAEQAAQARGAVLAPIPPAERTQEPPRRRGNWREMFGPVYRRRTFAIWAIWFCSATNTYGLTSWMPTLYKTEFKLPLETALLYGLITTAAGLAGAGAAALLIDRIGRRRLFIGGFVITACVLLVLLGHGVTSAELLLVFVSVANFFMIGVAVGLNLYNPELFPTRIRSIATSVGSSWQRVAATAGPVVIGAVLPAFGLRPVFLYFGGLAAVGALLVLAFAPETSGRRLEDVSP